MSLGVTLRIDPRPRDGEGNGASSFRRLRELFDQLSDVDPEERGERLAALAVPEPDLAAELAVLLDHADRSRSPLDSPSVVTVPDVPVEVPGYRVGRLVGRGGSSWVYLADQDLDGIERRVALKVIGGIEAERFLQRFEAEKRILAGLEHPGIARLYDAGRTGGGFAFLAMEYVEGSDLLTYCQTRGASIADRLRLFLRVLAAVSYAHQNLIVHRDLKPANIMVSLAGNPKLLDFGIAALLDPELEGGELENATLLRALTPAYASPEQIRGERVTTSTDVFSLGVVLYELLVGKRPHEPSTVGGELERGYREVLLPPPSVALAKRREAGEAADDPRAVAGDLDAIVMKALRSDAAERYRSVAALSEDLRLYLEGRPVGARPASWPYRAAKVLKRHRVASLATLIVTLAAATGLAVHVQQLGRERDRANAAAEQARREAETSARVADLVASIFDAANPTDQTDHPLTGKEILERGARSVETALTAEPDIRARMHVLLGGIWVQMGELDRAEKLIGPSIADLEKRLGPNHATTAGAKGVLALIRHAQGRDRESKAIYQEALAGRRIALGPRHAKVGILLGQYANTLKALGEFALAKKNFEESLSILAETFGPMSGESGKAWGNYGLLLFRMDDWRASAAATERCLAIFAQVYGRESPRYAATLVNLAEVREKQGRYPEALKAIQESIRLSEKISGKGYVAESIHRNVLGWTYMDLHRPLAARPEFERSIEAALQRYGRHPTAAWPMRGLAEVELALHHPQAARDHYERALRIRLETRGENHWEVAQSLGDMAYVEGRLHHPAAEESYLRRALAVRRAVHDPTHPDLARAVARLGEFLCTGKATETSATEGRDLLDQALALAAGAGKSSLFDAEEVVEWTATRAKCGR
ncbi:MAG TPA: serine/threonine-protein kinase [Thermoanaerobaculia bacterium]|jgi:serine/threonine-protein kinase|nr:serine/threonine-protein kinase [Thermoanaerobaculia bacterium]